MNDKRLVIIPVFLPWMGCSNHCIYCNEHAVTGYDYLNYRDQDIFDRLDVLVNSNLSKMRGNKRVQIAFFGGSFSNSPIHLQERFLRWANSYIRSGEIDSIRISTRPDGITDQQIELFKQYHCESVELGVQSFNDEVLFKNNRGHDSQTAVRAVKSLISEGFETGVHLMTGLFGSNLMKDYESFKTGLSLNPDSMRVHPTLVLKDTPLEQLYRNGLYQPLKLRETVEELGRYLLLSRTTGVKLNRIGLFIPHELESSVIAGPYHPAIGDMANTMARVLDILSVLAENDRVILDKRSYDLLKTHHGFFYRYVKSDIESGRIKCFSGGE